MDSCWPASNTDPALSSAPHGLPPFLVHSILDFSMELQDRVALITGSGRGIGRAIAQLFAKEGAAVFLTARTEKELASSAATITSAGGRAGYVPGVPVEEYPLAEFDKVIAVHLRAAFLLSKLVLPEMYARQSGVILNISSLAAKAGMLGLTRVMAAEGARKGVRVNAICPGPVTETQMSKDLGAVLAKKMGVNEEEQLAGFLNGLLQGRAQTTAEIARAALFLCSKQSSAMTGQSINVDGGAAFY